MAIRAPDGANKRFQFSLEGLNAPKRRELNMKYVELCVGHMYKPFRYTKSEMASEPSRDLKWVKDP